LQVIVKVENYILQPGDIYDGVWHAKGMADEATIATDVLTLECGRICAVERLRISTSE